MTVLAVVVVLIVGGSAVMTFRRLQQGDDAASAYVAELKQIDEDRSLGVARVNSTVEAVTGRMDSWTAAAAMAITGLETAAEKALGGRNPGHRPDPSPTTVVSVATGAGSQVARSLPGPNQVITAPPGRVPEDYSAAEFRNTVETVQKVREQHPPLSSFFPTDPNLPVHFIVPTMGRPDGETSAESVVSTEDHDAALTMLLAVLTRWPQAKVERGRVSPYSEESEWAALRGHLCTFCRERRNPLTRALLEHASTRAMFDLSFPKNGTEHGVALNGIKHLSPADDPMFGEAERLHEREDVALIARFPNPWFPKAKAMIVAGTRAYGTWGAAQYLRYHWDDLMQEVGKVDSSQPIEQRDFACVVRVRVAYGVGSRSEAHLPLIELNRDPLTVVKLVPRFASGSIVGIADRPSAA